MSNEQIHTPVAVDDGISSEHGWQVSEEPRLCLVALLGQRQRPEDPYAYARYLCYLVSADARAPHPLCLPARSKGMTQSLFNEKPQQR
jgi:hypothetical protein